MARDPVTNSKLLILNYLSLSKRPRYRKFFFQANNALRFYMLRKLFVTWSTY